MRSSGRRERQEERTKAASVERRKPERRLLHVLGRFTRTEADAFAQYEKLLAAYALADWSEEYFNNRALFSDYFLKERLTDPEEFPEWREDPKPAYCRLRQIYQTAAARVTGASKAALRANYSNRLSCEGPTPPVLAEVLDLLPAIPCCRRFLFA